MAIATLKDAIRLNYYAGDVTPVIVTPADHDRFMLSVKDAALACQAGSDYVAFYQQFEKRLLPRLAAWLTEHKEKVHQAFVSVREGGLLFLVVRQQARYDAEFTDDLSALDAEIARNPEFNMIRLDVLALPLVSDEGARSFLNPEAVMVFHAKPR
ncbi:MAG: hypothetical protein ISS78_01205 [Phycisphaerae bacterium]|nr:hypothetical protein [Phycisphaerae bacterium]